MQSAPPTPSLLPAMTFRSQWRKYQVMILDLFEGRDPQKRTFHVVAPPGSGKTLVGLEVIRRLGRPAVTFSPTTTIQGQWRERVRLFLPDPPAGEASPPGLARVSTDPVSLRDISCLTYQSLSTQTEEREFLERLGRLAWIEELLDAGRSPEGAAAHLDDVRARAADVYDEGVRRRARVRKRELLASGEARIEDLLHPNALGLIERIVAQGTGCIVLDEAHHLLDYWAMILAHLIGRLPQALVVGLTATPPASADPEEMGNYLALVDGIDFEVPTPAVVRSGHLAPYQDLVLFTEPTPTELEFLRSKHRLLEQAFGSVFDDPRFPGYVEQRVNRGGSGSPSWRTLFEEEFDVAVAGVRFLLVRGQPLADDVEVIPEMRRPLSPADRRALVRDWCLGFLRLSKDPVDRERLADLRQALRTLGLVLTETGWRRGPSPLDRVLAYSRSKVEGMVRILGEEAESMGDALRAVVVTDYERTSATALRRLEGVLDPESGGAVQAVRALVAGDRTRSLHPVMVTGRTVLVAEAVAEQFLAEASAFFEERGLHATLSAEPVEEGLVEVDGEGPDWAPRAYVAFVTALFERGVTRCLVGTRGLLAEGWDALSLNTLVDLTTAGTFASVNQLRGRSIRLDPQRPRKVADNWDLVCLARGVEGGFSDLERFVGKHSHTWGLGPGERIVKGAGHVDPQIPMLAQGWAGAALTGQHVTPEELNARSLRRARHRDKAYDQWGVGRPYDNFEFRATVLSGQDLGFKTAFTWKRSLRALLNLAIGHLLLYLILASYAVPQLLSSGMSALLVVLLTVAILLVAVGATVPLFLRYFRAAFLELPVDSYLGDFGRAVAQALKETGLAAASPDQVRVVETAERTYDVHLDTRDRVATDLFAQAFQDLFDPVIDQRYLVVREEASLSGTFYKPIWYAIRSFSRVFRRGQPFYHPVPTVFGRRRELAEAFGVAWARWVGGGALIYTRTPEGAAILLRERAAARLADVTSATFDEWR